MLGNLNAIVKKFLEFVQERYNCLHGNRGKVSNGIGSCYIPEDSAARFQSQ
jgi:hypothetical protein